MTSFGIIKECNYEIEFLASFENQEALLTAMLNGCVISKSAAKRLEELLQLNEEERKEKIESAFKNSLGYGHNAALDVPTYIVSFEQIPRLITLMMARMPRGFDLLQQSTRRVEHKNIYLPETIEKNEKARKLFLSTIEEVMQAYFKILDNAKTQDERKNLRQDAMYVTPLYLTTNIAIKGSARGFNQFITESRQENMPEVSKKIATRLYDKLKEQSEPIFREWKSNYEIHEFYPTASDFLFPNYALKKLIEKNKEKIPTVVNAEIPFSWQEAYEDIKNNNPATLSNIVHNKITVLTSMDISIMHEMIRQRTLDQSYESFTDAIERDNVDFTIPTSLKKLKLEDFVMQQYHKLRDLYFKLVNEGIPKNDAVGVIPHATKVYAVLTIDGWNLMHVSEKRLCGTAKPEMTKTWLNIKKAIINYLAENKPEDKEVINKLMQPQGVFYNGCTEKAFYERCPYKKLCGNPK